jgi:SPP1 gp7 family putative phage head morphogenesis protein
LATLAHNRADTIAQLRGAHHVLRVIGKPHRRRAMPRQIHPNGVAFDYRQSIIAIQKHARAMVNGRVVPRLKMWEMEAGTWKLDSAGSEATDLFASMSERFFEEFPNKDLAHLSNRIAHNTSRFQKEQLGRQIKSALAVDVFKSEPWLESKAADFTAENVALIRSIPERYFTEIQSAVMRGVRKGDRPSTIAAAFEDRYRVSESRAQLIAKDQVGKFFGELNKQRQTDLGVESYIWGTSEDERVRASHEELDGEEFDWSDPPTVDEEEATPGSPILCRCQALPQLDQLIADLAA